MRAAFAWMAEWRRRSEPESSPAVAAEVINHGLFHQQVPVYEPCIEDRAAAVAATLAAGGRWAQAAAHMPHLFAEGSLHPKVVQGALALYRQLIPPIKAGNLASINTSHQTTLPPVSDPPTLPPS